MKFAGFSLRLDSLDVQMDSTYSEVTVAGGIRLHAFFCSRCNFTRPRMFLLHCGHLLCDACALTFDNRDDNRAFNALCPMCSQTTEATLLMLSEAFVSGLSCLCPRCRSNVYLGNMKFHLKACLASLPLEPDREDRSSTKMTYQCNAPVMEECPTRIPSQQQGFEAHDGPSVVDVIDSEEESDNVNDQPEIGGPWVGVFLVALTRTRGFRKCYTSTIFRIRGMGFWLAVDSSNVHVIALDVEMSQQLNGTVSVFGLGDDTAKTQSLSRLSAIDCLGTPLTCAGLAFGAPANIDLVPHLVQIRVELE